MSVRGGYLTRAAALPPAEARRAWGALLAKARAVAGGVVDGGGPAKLEIAALAGMVIRMKAPLPLRAASAQAGAEAFLILARSFVAGNAPAWLALPLAALASGLQDQLDAETRAQFAQSCRVTGEA